MAIKNYLLPEIMGYRWKVYCVRAKTDNTLMFAGLGSKEMCVKRWKYLTYKEDKTNLLTWALIKQCKLRSPSNVRIMLYGIYRTRDEARGVLATLKHQNKYILIEDWT